MEDEERKAKERERQRRNYQEHKEKRLAYQKRRYSANREEIRAQQHDYYAAHRDEILARKHDYYADHAEEKRAYNREYGREREQQYREWLNALRITQGCAVCGRKDGKLDFHHKDPTTKRYNVADMAGYSLDTIEEELERCVVLCPSCHQKAHRDMEAGKTPAYEQATEEVECA